MATKTDTRKKAMIQALEKSIGIVTTACKTAGVSRETHYKWMNEDGDYNTQVLSVGDMALDFAESQLFQNIKKSKETSILFYLKCKGKKRGYIERTEVENHITGEVKNTIDPKQLQGAIQEVIDKNDC